MLCFSALGLLRKGLEGFSLFPKEKDRSFAQPRKARFLRSKNAPIPP
jgi:hypothetical protein